MARVLVVAHGYPPAHRAGAEWALHELVLRLAAHGHDLQVVQTAEHPGGFEGGFEGVEVLTLPGFGPRQRELLAHARRADAVLTHLDHGLPAAQAARAVGIPVIHYVHNHRQLETAGVGPQLCDLALMNSQWLAKTLDWPGEWMVQTPIVPVARYAVTEPRGESAYTTLVSLTRDKGVRLFQRLAQAEPGRAFLGVVGAYGEQDRAELGNVVYAETTTDMRAEVYARTRVLLVPSVYESWGRVAVEAMAAGIPVVAHPTEGLRESLDDVGLFADRDDLEAWSAALAALDEREFHAEVAAAGRLRALVLEARALEQAADVSSWLWHNT